jgi:hypothetical protein
MSIEALKAALAAGPTDGPWHVFSVYAEHEVRTPSDSLVAVAQGRPEARLIAAASPDVIRSLIERMEEAERELERERMRLAACGVVALANTPESAATARDMAPEYRSGSCDDVASLVDREIELRARLEAAEADARRLDYIFDCEITSARRYIPVEPEKFKAQRRESIDAQIAAASLAGSAGKEV